MCGCPRRLSALRGACRSPKPRAFASTAWCSRASAPTASNGFSLKPPVRRTTTPPFGRCLGTQGVNTVLERLQQALIARGWDQPRAGGPAGPGLRHPAPDPGARAHRRHPLCRLPTESLTAPACAPPSVGAATAAAIGAVAGGTAGAASAYNVDVNNRQLHPTERGVLRAEAKRVAREQIQGFDQLSPEQQANAESYWYNQLSAAALARVDDKGQAARDAYLADVAGTNQPGLQGRLTSAQVLANANVASSIVDRLASQSAPIMNMYGEPLQSSGQSLTAFNATAEQRANSYLLNTPTAEAERQQIANQNRATLNYLGAANGSAARGLAGRDDRHRSGGHATGDL